MPNNKKSYQQQVARWQKEGRGNGTGSSYKPWLTVRDVSSKGRSHRAFGRVAKRIHHLLSDLELAVLLILDWDSRTEDIREQFPLRIEETQALAEGAGIKHPAKGKEPAYMTTDFLVDTSKAGMTQFALQAKYATDLDDRRTVEKLEIERLYWQSKGVPWFIVTEREIPIAVFKNIDWLYQYMDDQELTESTAETLEHYLHHFSLNPDQSIIEIAKTLDRAYGMKPGESLGQIRRLMAQRQLSFDIKKPYQQLTGQELLATDRPVFLELAHVSEE